MKIAIFLGWGNGSVVDASHVELGNPGVGGTQYCMLELAHYLNNNTCFGIYMLAQRSYKVESGVNFIQVNESENLCKLVESIGADILILSQFNDKRLEEDIARIKCKVIIWSHNYIYADFCDFISTTETIKANVFVGKQQYDRYIDDDVVLKSTYIHNMFHDNTPNVERENDCRTVVYMGALVEGKGFAELCSIWPSIIQEIPNARLLVLGSGGLYASNQFGRYGIASHTYENKFIKYITDESGEIIPSVEFLGVVGDGKTDIFRKASVGVVNPTARTETFCMGVVEMAEAKLPVVTIGKNGYFDTVVDGETGFLGNSLDEVRKYIVNLLRDSSKNIYLGDNAKRRISKFSPRIIGPQWVDLLEKVHNGTYIPNYKKPSKPMTNNFKWIRASLRFLRFTLCLRFVPSLIEIESFGVKLISRLRK